MLCEALRVRHWLPACPHSTSLPPSLPPSALTLERCLKRLEWDRVRDKEQKDAADEADKERNAVQAIDW